MHTIVRRRYLALAYAVWCLSILAGPLAWAAPSGNERHINIAAFQLPAGVESEALFTGQYSELMRDMEQRQAVPLFILRTPAVRDRDVVNFQSDVLHLGGFGSLHNTGLDCQFSYDNESDEDGSFYSISGICTYMPSGGSETEKHRMIIKRVMLPDVMPNTNVWARMYVDESSHIVFYADMD